MCMAETARTEQFVRLLATHQEDIFRYIFALLPNEEDGRDVLQETCIALYRKLAEYDGSKPFLPWAYGFAYMEVLKHRERNRRVLQPFSAELLEMLAREREQQEEALQARLRALDECVSKLPEADRRLLRQRYEARLKMDELIDRVGSSRRTLFRNLERIRRVLFDCVSRRVAAERV